MFAKNTVSVLKIYLSRIIMEMVNMVRYLTYKDEDMLMFESSSMMTLLQKKSQIRKCFVLYYFQLCQFVFCSSQIYDLVLLNQQFYILV